MLNSSPGHLAKMVQPVPLRVGHSLEDICNSGQGNQSEFTVRACILTEAYGYVPIQTVRGRATRV